MARVDVRVDDFEDGALPRVCASSGAPADGLYKVEATYKPSWPAVFIVLGPIGWLVMLVAAAGNTRRVTGLVPFADAAHQRMVRVRWVNWRRALEVAAGTVVGVVLLALLNQTTVAIVVAFVGVAVTIGFWVAGSRPPGSVGVKLARNGRSIEMVNVSDAFIAGYREQEVRRRAVRQHTTDSSGV